MAITLRELCEKASYLYGMRIIAGESGTDNIVQWIHTLEDVETCDFIHGSELIFTTGIAQVGTEWLLEFVKGLFGHEASGLVINIGPYITSVPAEVIEYCNRVNFPLLEVPWKTRLVDITRDFSNQIFQNEKEEENLADILKSIIFDPAHADEYLPSLARNNFSIETSFCIIGIHVDFLEQSPYRQNMFKSHLLRRVERMSGAIGYFINMDTIFLILNNFTESDIRALVTQVGQNENTESFRLKIAVGKNENGIANLASNYKKVCSLLHLARKNDISPLYYEAFGMKKILLSVSETSVLEDYYDETLGKLERFDAENGTAYLNLLRQYLELDGSVQTLADTVFVHRNTINYQLNKVKKIIGNDFSSLDSRFRLILAYQIKDIIS